VVVSELLKNKMFKTKNIGVLHRWFHHEDKGRLTQVLVVETLGDNEPDIVIAQFYGPEAKILAANLVGRLNIIEKSDKDLHEMLDKFI
jgi:hypothetical protein